MLLAEPVDRSQTPKGRRARDRIVQAAEPLLATHGFHGTSMRDLAAAAELPLATVVYHFAKKEQLYAAVLSGIGEDLERVLDEAMRDGDHKARIIGFAAMLVDWMLHYPHRVRLILREVLDNPVRVARASQLPLADFLLKAAAFIAEGRGSGAREVESPTYTFLHLFGGISYVIAARPTLDRIRQRNSGEASRLRADRYQRDAMVFACRLLGLKSYEESNHEGRTSASGRPSRTRSPRAANHRRRS